MADTVSSKKIEGVGERPRSPSTKDAERREESKVCSRGMKWGATQPKPSKVQRKFDPSLKCCRNQGERCPHELWG